MIYDMAVMTIMVIISKKISIFYYKKAKEKPAYDDN